jgi:hypothetical protein
MMPFLKIPSPCRTSWQMVTLGIVLALASMASNAHALSPDESLVVKFVGKHWVNGRSWEKLEYSGKLGFVCGLFDGVTLFWSAAETGKKSNLEGVYKALSIPASFTVGDVVKGMDEFYEDGENQQLPAICAYLFIAYKSRGESAEAMGRKLRLWRRMFHE